MTRTSSLIALIAASVVAVPLASASDLTVTVEGIADAKGTIMLGLFDEATYNGDGAVNGANLKVEGTSVTATFEGLEPGEYAVRLYHDLNDDGEMNTNPFGMRPSLTHSQTMQKVALVLPSGTLPSSSSKPTAPLTSSRCNKPTRAS